MAAEFELTDEMRAVVGVESEPWPVEITTTSVRAFARGVGYTDAKYFDLDAAKGQGYDTLPAPPCYLGTPCGCRARATSTFSGPAQQRPVDLSTASRACSTAAPRSSTSARSQAGDRLFMRSKVSNLEVKESKGLGKMLVVTSEQTFTEQDTGDVVMRTYAQAIYY